jgi:hypothetical protein
VPHCHVGDMQDCETRLADDRRAERALHKNIKSVPQTRIAAPVKAPRPGRGEMAAAGACEAETALARTTVTGDSGGGVRVAVLPPS